jgi:septal ring factor EnvC (AmiA/AmiB activator)
MKEQLAELRSKLAEAEARATEEQRRREAAEADAQQSQPKNLIEYLEACHNFPLDVVTNATLTTQGDTTKPAGRPFPQRIVSWDDFLTQQENI